MSPRLFRPEELYEVCQRTNRGELCFDLNNIEQIAEITGLLGEAQRLYRVPIFAFQFMSNHYHGLFAAPTAQQFSGFLGFFHSGVARMVNRDRPIPGAVWGGAPHIMPVAIDEAVLLRRVRYIMGQGVKANLAPHPCLFPGPSSTDWLTGGVPIIGRYHNRTQACRDKRLVAGPKAPEEYCETREVAIAKLPGYEHRAWADLHPQFMGIADDIAGASLADWAANGHRGKLHNIDLTLATHDHTFADRDSLKPVALPRSRGSLAINDCPPVCHIQSIQAESVFTELATAALLTSESTSAATACPPVDPTKVQVPSRQDDATGQMQQRPKPKSARRQGAKKKPKIHAATNAAQDQYADEFAEFCKARAVAQLGLARNLRGVVQGKRWRTVRIPHYALFGGGLGGAARL